MENEYDKWQDEQHVPISYALTARLHRQTVDAILRNAERPSDWEGNRLPAHVSTRDGLAESTRQFLKTNPDYMFPDVDKTEDSKPKVKY